MLQISAPEGSLQTPGVTPQILWCAGVVQTPAASCNACCAAAVMCTGAAPSLAWPPAPLLQPATPFSVRKGSHKPSQPYRHGLSPELPQPRGADPLVQHLEVSDAFNHTLLKSLIIPPIVSASYLPQPGGAGSAGEAPGGQGVGRGGDVARLPPAQAGRAACRRRDARPAVLDGVFSGKTNPLACEIAVSRALESCIFWTVYHAALGMLTVT